MAIYLGSLPYLLTQNKKVALPKNATNDKLGYGCLAFLFVDNHSQAIKIMNNTDNCYHDNKYHYYYYNLLYKGTIANRRYNIRDAEERKNIYARVSKETNISPYPSVSLNSGQAKNCYFDLSKYKEIYSYMTEKKAPNIKMGIFWAYFKSIFNGAQTNNYKDKFVIINADNYSNFKGKLIDTINNPVFMIYYTLYKNYKLISDLNMDFYIYTSRNILRINPSMCNEKSHIVFKRELTKLYNKIPNFDILPEDKIDEEEKVETIKTTLKNKYNFTGKEETDVTSLEKKPVEKKTDLEKKIEDKVETKVQKVHEEIKEVLSDDYKNDSEVLTYVKTQTEMELEEDKDLIESIYKEIKQEKVPSTPISSARDREMRKRQESLTMGSLSFSNINEKNESKRLIPVKDVSTSIASLNENVKHVKFANINKDYLENVMPHDLVKTFTCLNNKSIKMYVRDIKIKDTSDELNYKDTYYVTLEDSNKQRHSITVDIPKFLDNKFMYLGGNKKIINRQNFLYPVVKTGPDTVQIVTNYNKMFIRRVGTKSISSVERVMKLIAGNEECYNYFTIGDASVNNANFVTTIEYDEFSKNITKFKSSHCTIFFNQLDASTYVNQNNIEVPDGYIFIGTKDKDYLFLDTDTQLVITDKEIDNDTNDDDNDVNNDEEYVSEKSSNGHTICDIIINELPEYLQKEFMRTKSTKRLMYNTVTIMSQTIPFVVILLFWDGFTSVINKMKVKHRFSDKYPHDIKPNESVIKFKDAYFIYEGTLADNLLLNGIKALDTENYNIRDYDTNEPFIDYFRKVYGKVTIMNALQNFAEFTLDPITLEVLEDINLPTDLIELCIYANNLLADESYTKENSQEIARVRSLEIIPAILYNCISREYLNFSNTNGKSKLSLPKDCVIKQLMGLQTVEDYSTLNPSVELEKDRALTAKGFRGVNVDRAYSEEKRGYHETMIGVVAMSTSPDGNCGINRFMTMEPNITSARGYVDIKNNKREELKDINLFCPTEMLYPLGNTRDDPVRIAMSGKQSKHVIPVKNASPALISNGTDEYIKYNLSSDFVIVAEEDGQVIDYDEKSQILIIEYKSGKKRAVDLSPNIVKNGGGGFFLNNTLISKYKVGDKFKQNDTIAYHRDFFKDDKFNNVRMNVGVLEKVAIISSYGTYNDSAFITEKLANDAQCEMTFCKSVVLGKNSNVYDMRQIGETVSIGDPLISFDTSFDDSDLNKLLANLSDENKEILNEGSTNVIKSKYAGKIVDIKMYSTVDVSELSESLQKIIKSYYNKVDHKKKFVSKYDPGNTSIVKCGLLLNETTGKIEPNIYGVIKGQKVQDSVLIEFYIEHADIMGVGDKLAFFTALKSVICEVIPEGYEPYSEFRPDEEVSSAIGPSAILKRQTPSIILTLLGNKVIVELKRKLEEIYNS